ncbi:hypothetical protein H7U19_12705 [Hyunsoonleella sp. SJ7]|uniref:Receptor L-domain domain-containing protein n=1 Tax=Hyunsoonleella aquatilis TaxID=2762758 RepID=A0A923H8P7_9FLAO|nr:hypothetical protein [Hyunsoonleella aquatilis]MBC3759271.1 hypothetical protein [Hyunsoonleella aquatilis]
MKKIILLIVSFALFILSCSKENETNDIELNEIEFTTQEDINAFNNEAIKKIGFLKISGSDISDLSALNSLTLVSKLEIVNNPKLISLHGLENLLTVSESLSITNNRSLGDFEAIKNLNIDNLIDGNSLSNKGYVSKNPNNSFKIENNLFNPTKDSLKITYKLKEKIYSGNLIINCNQYLKNFIKEKYTIIDGDLTIKDDNCTSNSGLEVITSLIGLESISKVNGTLQITSSPYISSLEGLENLTYTSHLFVNVNQTLVSLNGIENITSANRIFIGSNESLKNLKGLENLNLTESFEIIKNKNLTNLTDFVNFNYASSLTIKDNPQLVNLKGLENIERIQGGVNIISNNSLVDLTGLNGLSRAKVIKIENNKTLENLKGLEGIHTEYGGISTSSGVDLIINNNESLENLTELDIAAIGNLFITNNNNLKNLIGLNSLKSATTLKIENNDSLSSLLGLESLIRIINKFHVTNNINLVDFCPINKDFKIYNQFQSSYNVTGNAYNPLINHMVSTDKCK